MRFLVEDTVLDDDYETPKIYAGWIAIAAIWQPRILGTLTVVSSACMIGTALRRREHIFHRLILGMAINLLVMGVSLIFGIAAFPKEHEDFGKGYGTTATCTAQGFFIQFGLFSALFYYSFFSVYSYECVLNNFDVSKFRWIEKYIHVLAYVFPLASAIVTLSLDGYNPIPHGFCGWSTTIPLWCGTDYAECERGVPPKSYNMIFIIPELLVLFVSTGVMIALYWKVKRHQPKYRLQARSIAYQASVYLLMLYWFAIPLLIMDLIQLLPQLMTHKFMTFVVFVSVVTTQSIGLFTLIVYRYFSTGTYHRWDSFVGTLDPRKAVQTAKDGNDDTNEGRLSVDPTEAMTDRFDFNIFDGSNAGGAYAEFVHDGDDEDETNDNHETEHWSGMQGL